MATYRKLRDKLLERPAVRQAYDVQRELGRLGGLFERARRTVKLRQVDLAAAANIAQSEISRMEAGLGDRGPTFDTLLRIAHAQNMKLMVELVPADKAEDELETTDRWALDEDRPLREAF